MKSSRLQRLRFIGIALGLAVLVLALGYCWLAFRPTAFESTEDLRADLENFNRKRVAKLDALKAPPPKSSGNQTASLKPAALALENRPTTMTKDYADAESALTFQPIRGMVMGSVTVPSAAFFQMHGVAIPPGYPAGDKPEDWVPLAIGRGLIGWSPAWTRDLSALKTPAGLRRLGGQMDAAEADLLASHEPYQPGDDLRDYYTRRYFLPLAAWRAALRGDKAKADWLTTEMIRGEMAHSGLYLAERQSFADGAMLSIVQGVFGAIRAGAIGDDGLRRIDAMLPAMEPDPKEIRKRRAAKVQNQVDEIMRRLNSSQIRINSVRDSGFESIFGEKLEPTARKMILPVLKAEIGDWVSAFADGDESQVVRVRMKFIDHLKWLDVAGLDSGMVERAMASPPQSWIEPERWAGQPNAERLATEYDRRADAKPIGDQSLRMARAAMAAGRFRVANGRWPADFSELQGSGFLSSISTGSAERIEILHIVPEAGTMRTWSIESQTTSRTLLGNSFERALNAFHSTRGLLAPASPETLAPIVAYFLNKPVQPADIADRFHAIPAMEFPPMTVIAWIDRKVDLRHLLAFLPEGADVTEDQVKWLQSGEAGWRVMFVAIPDEPVSAEAEELLKAVPSDSR